MSSEQNNMSSGVGGNKRAYERPSVKRVDLTLAETLSAACKVEGDGGPCDPTLEDPAQELGS